MPQKWTPKEEKEKYTELKKLYIDKNKTLREIADILQLAPSTVYDRMIRLHIIPTPERKKTYAAQRRSDINIPKQYTSDLAEFFGIMLGDGKLSFYQVFVTLGTKELLYAEYVCDLMEKLFAVRPKIFVRNAKHYIVYIGSRDLSDWFKNEGLVYNKVLAQVDVPRWIFSKNEFMEKFLKGFFDTDGSIYKLRFGFQLSFTNMSKPLLVSIQLMLKKLGYTVSELTAIRCYVTKHNDVIRFFKEIQPANPKHQERFVMFTKDLGR